ncbi:hypothetical protein [Nonomuraea sp. NPDC050310]|uniref:hypothetical protein n=1 Tax=unclassified Nonomuraea TaxID=2593643 RepID=UPI0033FDF826
MKRRILTLLAAGALTALALPTAAHADTVTATHGPLSIGGYCSSQVNSTAWIGFYEVYGLNCYASKWGGGFQFVGAGSPMAACAHLMPGVTITSASRAASDALTCTGTR